MIAMASQITGVSSVCSILFFRRRLKKTSKFRVADLCEGNPPVTNGFPSQRASNAENVSIWWRHHETKRSENDNTPQPPDQWTNSPLMGQQFGNWVSHWPMAITWVIYLPCTVAQEQVHCASNIVSNTHLFHSKSIDLPIPKIWLLIIWPWKSDVKVMGEVKVQSHNVSLISYRLTSIWFNVNRSSHPWGTAFSKFDIENPRSRSRLKMTK